MTALQLSLKDSVTTRLFRIVFLIYFFITLCLTISQMYTEYLNMKEVVLHEVKLLTTTVKPGLAKSLWDVDLSQVASTVEVLKSLPIITGLKIEDEEGVMLAQINLSAEREQLGSGINEPLESTSKSFQYEFDIVYSEKDKTVGKGTFYSSSDVVMGRVKYGFLLIIINSIIKTLSLWTIFLVVSRQILAKPLNQLIGFIRAIDLDNLEQLAVKIKTRGNNELKIIENTLNEMIKKLIGARRKIDEHSQELAEKNIELEKMDRLKDDFLANTSHELRTPLHGIIGIADSMQDALPQPEMEPVRMNLDMIVQTGRHLSLLVDDILDFSKLKHHTLQLHRQAVDVKRIVDVVFRVSEPLIADKPLVLENRLSNELPKVDADEKRVQQIIQNLVGNAIKFSNQGVIYVDAKVEADMLEISVCDSGQAIDPEHYETVFNAFEQLDGSLSRQYTGAGLGLTITRQLVELHGGSIHVRAAERQGNHFIFALPLSDKPEIVVRPLPAIGASIAPQLELVPIFGHGEKNINVFTILVVDDDITNLQVVFNHLAFRNYGVYCVQSGQEAIQWIETNGTPDLVLLDIMMPEMNGFEVCHLLRQQYGLDKLPIIFLTASHRRKDIDSGFRLGANDYLTKPFEKSELVYRIRVHLQLLMAKKQLISLKDCANQIADFNGYDQMLRFSLGKMADIRFVSDSSVLTNANTEPAENLLQKSLLPLNTDAYWNQFEQHKNQELILLNNIPSNNSISEHYMQKYSIDVSGGHFILINPTFASDCHAVLYRDKQRLPFQGLDLAYITSMLQQISRNKETIQTMLSDHLIQALSEVQPYLSTITHITASTPYCSVHFENQSVEKEIRISLSQLELYFSTDSMFRVHRSALVNPSKILGIEKTAAGKKKYRYEVLLKRKSGLERIRIGDSYLESARKQLPQHFHHI